MPSVTGSSVISRPSSPAEARHDERRLAAVGRQALGFGADEGSERARLDGAVADLVPRRDAGGEDAAAGGDRSADRKAVAARARARSSTTLRLVRRDLEHVHQRVGGVELAREAAEQAVEVESLGRAQRLLDEGFELALELVDARRDE